MHLNFLYYRPINFLFLLSIFLFIINSTALYAAEPTAATTTDTTKVKDSKNPDVTASESETTTTDKAIALTPEEQKIADQKVENIAKITSLQQALESLRTEIENSKENSSLNSNKVKAIKESFNSLESRIQDVLGGLGNNSGLITSNAESIKELKVETMTLLRSTRANLTDIGTQKSMIEDNSIRLYEILVKIDEVSESLRNLSSNKNTSEEAINAQNTQDELSSTLNRLWILVSILFVSLTPLAYVFASDKNTFLRLKDGTPHSQGIILVSIAASLAYFIVGFGLMYGDSSSGWIGLANYFFNPDAIINLSTNIPFAEFMLYQTGFAMLSALIVYTAIGKYLPASLHILLAMFVGAILVPIFGHWAWSGNFIIGNKGWLEAIGFIDQSGSTIVHAVAAWFAFVIIRKLGASDVTKKAEQGIGDYPVYPASAALLLLLSWQGFTTGTLPISDSQISNVLLNNILAASAGGMMASLHYIFFHSDKGHITRGLSGFMSGLVAISACAQIVTFAEALAIGALAGILQNITFTFLHKYFLRGDSQIPATYLVSIHGISGIWGTLCVALLGTEGTFSAINSIQLVIQLKGIGAALLYSFIIGIIVANLLQFKLKKQEKKIQHKQIVDV